MTLAMGKTLSHWGNGWVTESLDPGLSVIWRTIKSVQIPRKKIWGGCRLSGSDQVFPKTLASCQCSPHHLLDTIPTQTTINGMTACG